MQSLSLICPAYQDEENIGTVVSKALTVLQGLVDPFEVIVVDDGSTDKTFDRAVEAAKGDPRVRLLRHPSNRGYGQAIRSGIASASPMEFVCLTDGDGQYNVEELAQMLPLMDKADVVTGARRANRNPFLRRLMSYGFNQLIRIYFNVNYRDLTSSLKLFRRKACHDAGLISGGNFTDVELVLRAHYDGFRIQEVTIEHYPRVYGRSNSMSVKRILETFREMIRVHRSL